MRVLLKIFIESFLLAIQELRTNKLRASLSILGISIGIFCIISVFTMTDTMEYNVRDSLQKLGDNVIYVDKWPWYAEEYAWWKYWRRPSPKFNELKIIQERIHGAEASAILINFGGNIVEYENNRIEEVDGNAISHDYSKIQDINLESGRYFSQVESDAGVYVSIIGNDIATGLFPSGVDPIGKVITIIHRGGRFKFTIIGVLKKEGSNFFKMSNDNVVMTPYNSVRRVVDERQLDPTILVKAKEGISMDELNEELRGIMRALRKIKPKEEDNFALNRLSVLAGPLKSTFGVLNIGGWVIGGFAILVGGFGIANIMFVSVKERTNIIGIKKALGAKKYFILMEFLVESVILCLLGGLAGLLFVYLEIVLAKSFDFKLIMTLKNILTGINISVLIGIIAGFWPAFIASKMDPVEAIRQN